ncbi:MAG: class I SAM-dependent methyltransferase [Oscillospiraceae bacterium]
MNGKASITALMSAFGRAFHSEKDANPIFDDRAAKKLMTEEEYLGIGKYILEGMDFFAPEKKGTFENDEAALEYLVNTRIAPTPIARGRFCEDSLKTALLTGTKQYVIIGAGMDTFAFREPEIMKKCRVFEVDHPLTQADKIERVKRSGMELPDSLRYVSADLSKDSLKEKLVEAGFDASKKTFFSWLGVSYYLTLEQTEEMLENIALISADGSTLVFDYGDEGMFSSGVKRVENMIAMAAAGGEPMKSCYSYAELEKMLDRHGFLIYEALSPKDIQERYFDGHKGLSAFEHICLVTAVIKK